MKVRWPFIVGGFLSLLVVLVSVQSLRPPRYRPSNDVAISSLGYINQSNTWMAVFQVTNRTAATFMCFVGPRVSERSRFGRPIAGDLRAAASGGVVLPRGTFTFAVPAASDTNLLRVPVRLQELRAARPRWQAKLALVLRTVGIHAFEDKAYNLSSPAFSRPAT